MRIDPLAAIRQSQVPSERERTLIWDLLCFSIELIVQTELGSTGPTRTLR